MRICYITSQTPYGTGEQFILPEVLKLKEKNNDVIIIPIKPEAKLAAGKEPEAIAKDTIYIPLFAFKVFAKSLGYFLSHPAKVFNIVFKIFKYSGTFKKVLKNLAVLPKGIVTGIIISKKNIDHIHCHWASTPSTVGYIAASISNTSWSFTSHRWDIAENNMLVEKAKTAKFIRVIDDPGYNEMIGFIGEENKNKCTKIHVGVNMSSSSEFFREKRDNFIIVMAANFIDKKGHIYLLKSLINIKDKGYKVYCHFYGDGPLEESLKNKAKEYNVDDMVSFDGKIAHDKLIKQYTDGKVDCVVLPSIVTEDGEKEGIPVSLMEAMAAKVPVISTNTGGIYELLRDNCGILIEQKNAKQLEEGIEKLINSKELQKQIAENGYKMVINEFYISTIVDRMAKLFKD
ncbi:glycosyltransferase involved in cell wall biosynthesis [Clostridium algifaecis]|uniref:Glycosyltransferase involved in cell wall biosynthesis n=1 Tax=Clostridium algifaecis TaxID=1472040 RepID=A0ABS4KR06_9CLOT|nr:glycosyltransferase family 4 protein [Clostridium algifaecis]MBP2032459.1 glycosyltransferase involved in cell wall biosynthesis [Clostridium algifaecis]